MLGRKEPKIEIVRKRREKSWGGEGKDKKEKKERKRKQRARE